MRSIQLVISAAVISSALIGSTAFAVPSHTSSKAQNKHSNVVKKKDDKSKKNHRYTICHATNSATNPYVMITVDYHSIVKHAGHDNHDGLVATSEAHAQELKSKKIAWGDVIPAIPEHDFNGQNTTEDGLRLLNNDCEMPDVVEQDVEVTKDEKPTGGSGSSSTPSAPSTPNPQPNPVEPVVDTRAAEAGKGGVATALPETGADSFVNLVTTIVAGLLAAATTYGGMHILRKTDSTEALDNL